MARGPTTILAFPMPLFLTRPFLQIILYGVLVIAGSVPEGGACTTDDDHIDPSSQRFLSDCDEKTFCSAQTNGTCKPKLCRRDEFPFGFQIGDVLPPLCPRGFFCPDQGSGCQELTLVGRPCQLNRDDQCAPSPEFASFSSNQNFNGSLCLQSICTCAMSFFFVFWSLMKDFQVCKCHSRPKMFYRPNIVHRLWFR